MDKPTRMEDLLPPFTATGARSNLEPASSN
jgi:hypothetical protein